MRIFPSVKWSQRVIAGTVAAAFFFTSVGEPFAQTNFWADRQAAKARTAGRPLSVAQNHLASIDWPKETLHPLLNTFKLPADLGSIVETHVVSSVGKPGQKTLLHIQDAHGIFDAQLNSAQILEGLRVAGWAGREAPIIVYQEGGTGLADTDSLSSFPFADIREEVGRAFLRQKEITGEEYRALSSSSGTFRLVGVETPDLYSQNLACRHETAPARAAADRQIVTIQTGLDEIKQRIYPPALLTLEEALKKYESHTLGFDAYVIALVKEAGAFFRAPDYPQLTAFLHLLRTERDLDFQALAVERTILVERLADQLSPEAIRDLTDRATALRAGRVTHREFYELLLSVANTVRRKGKDVPTDRLQQYVNYLRQTEDIRHALLLTESDKLRDQALDNLSGSDRVRRLVRMDRRLALEKLLWRQELSPDQYAALRQTAPLDWRGMVRFLTEEGIANIPNDFAWTAALPQVQAYYELAEKRDQALSQNALDEMDRTGLKRAVLIAGGFHTPGMARLWREQGINFVVVQPRFDLQEQPPAPGELKISQDMLIARAQVREMLGLGRDAAALPLGQGVNNRLPFAMLGRAIFEKVLSAVGPAKKERKEAAIQALQSWMDRGNFQVYSVAQMGQSAETATALIFGKKNGFHFVMAYRESGNSFVVIDPKKLSKDVSGKYNRALTRQLEGLVTAQGINWQGFVGSISAMGQRGLDAAAQAAKLDEAKTAFRDVLEPAAIQIVDFATKTYEPLTPQAREGEVLVNRAVAAAQVATQLAPSRIRTYFSGFLAKVFNKKTAAGAALLGVAGAAGATETAATVVSGASLLSQMAGIPGVAVGSVSVFSPFLGTLLGLMPVLLVLVGLSFVIIRSFAHAPVLATVSPSGPEIVGATPTTGTGASKERGLLAILAGGAVAAVFFLWLLPFSITFATGILPTFLNGLMAPVFLLLNVSSGIGFFMVALTVAWKVSRSPEYKDSKTWAVVRVAAPAIGLLFTSGVLFAALMATAAWTVSTSSLLKNSESLRPLAEKIENWGLSMRPKSAEFLTQFTSDLSPPRNPLTKSVVWAAKFLAHKTMELGGTFKSFAFQSALDLLAIYDGKSAKSANQLTSSERGFQTTLALLRGEAVPGSVRYSLAQALGLPALILFYTVDTASRRLSLMVLSSVATYTGTQMVGGFVAVAFLGGGLGGMIMGGTFLALAWGFYKKFGHEWVNKRSLAGLNTRMVLFLALGLAAVAVGGAAYFGMDQTGLLAKIFSLNLLDTIPGLNFDSHALATAAHANPHHHGLQIGYAFAQLATPTAWLGSLMLGLLMTLKSLARNVQLKTADETQTRLGLAARLVGWMRYAPGVARVLWNADLEKRRGFSRGTGSSAVGLQLVNPEVALAVGAATYAGDLNIGFEPVRDVILLIEGKEGIMGLSDNLTGNIIKAAFGEDSDFNIHDYTVLGTPFSSGQLAQMGSLEKQIAKAEKEVALFQARSSAEGLSTQGPEMAREKLTFLQEQLKMVSSPRSSVPSHDRLPPGKFRGLFPMVFDILFPSAHSSELTESELATSRISSEDKTPLPKGEKVLVAGFPVTGQYLAERGINPETGEPYVDIRCPAGTPLVAPKGLTILEVGTDASRGHYAVVGIEGQRFTFMHLNEPVAFERGDHVAAKTVFAQTGNTGNARGKNEGDHVYIEFKDEDGQPQDPLRSPLTADFLVQGVPAKKEIATERDREPFVVSIRPARDLVKATIEARIKYIQALSAQEYIQEHIAKYFTVDLQLVGALVRQNIEIPGEMREILKLVGEGSGGGKVFLLNGSEMGPGKTKQKYGVDARVGLIMNATIFDNDAKNTESVRRHAANMAQIMADIESKVVVPRQVVDYFSDIRVADEVMAITKDTIKQLKKEAANLDIKFAENVENKKRALGEIRRLLSEQELLLPKVRKEREAAVKKLFELMPGLWPDGLTNDEIQEKTVIDYSEAQIQDFINKSGMREARDLKLKLAKEKVLMLEAAIPAGKNYRLAIEILKGIIGAKFTGGVGLAVSMAARMTLKDPVREALKDAGVWAYAQSLIELAETTQSLEVQGAGSAIDSAMQDALVRLGEKTRAEGVPYAQQLGEKYSQDMIPFRDYLGNMKSDDGLAASLARLKRERSRADAEFAQFSKEGGYAVLRDPHPASIEKQVEAAMSGSFSLFDGMSDSLRARLADHHAKYEKALAPVNLGTNPGYKPLADMLLGRSYGVIKADLLREQREAELRSVVGPNYNISLYVGPSSEEKDVGNVRYLSVQAGVGLSYTFDPSKDLRALEYMTRVDVATLNAEEVTNKELADLGHYLQMLENFLKGRASYEMEIQGYKDLINQNEELEKKYNVNRTFQKNQDRKSLADAEGKRIQIEASIKQVQLKIDEVVGKTGRDTISFDSDFRAHNIHSSLPYLRFSDLVDRTEEEGKVRDRLNKVGKDRLEKTGEQIHSARALLVKMKDHIAAGSTGKVGTQPSIDAQLIEEIEKSLVSFEEMRQRTEKNALAGVQVYKDLNELSQRALALVVLKASLSPAVKWQTAEGLEFDKIINDWDKSYRGRFDAFSSERIALKTGEGNQLRATIAAGVEPLTVNINFGVLFAKSGGGAKIVGGVGVAELAAGVIEMIFSGFIPEASGAEGDEGPPDSILSKFIPGYQTSQQRAGTIKSFLMLAQRELMIAKQKETDVESNRISVVAMLRLGREIRDLMLLQVKAQQARGKSDVPRLVTQIAESKKQLELIKTRERLEDMISRVADLEVRLLALGMDPSDLPPEEQRGELGQIGVSFGGKMASQSIEYQLATLETEFHKLDTRMTHKALGVPRQPVSFGADFGNGKGRGIASFGLISPDKIILPVDEEGKQWIEQASADRAIDVLRGQGGRIQGDLVDLVSGGVQLSLSKDIYTIGLGRLKVLAAAGRASGEEYNTLYRLLVEFAKAWNDGGSSVRDAENRIRLALGRPPSEPVKRTYEEARASLRSSLSVETVSYNLSLHDPRQIVLSRIPSTQDLSLFRYIGGLPESVNGEGVVLPLMPETSVLKSLESLAKGERWRNTIIPTGRLTLFTDAMTNGEKIGELDFRWNLFGGGGASRLKIIGLEKEKVQLEITQKARSHQLTLDQNRRDMALEMDRIRIASARILELTEGDFSKLLHKDYVNQRVLMGDLGALMSELAKLTAERTDAYMRLALHYQISRDILRAYGKDIPLLEDFLDQLGVRRLDGHRSLYQEIQEQVLTRDPLPPIDVPVTPEWDVATRTPVQLHKPADGRIEQNPERTAHVYIDVFGERWKAPNTHLKYDGPAWFQSVTDGLAADVGMELGGQRILDRNDWGTFLWDLMGRYRMPVTPEFMANVRVAWQKVNREFKGYTDASEMPNSFSKYTEFAFKQRFPHHGPMTADYETNLRMDKNFHSKLGMTLYYANQMSIHGSDWLDKTFPEDAAFIHLMNKERNRGVPLTDTEKTNLLEWKKQHSSEMDLIFYRQIPENEREAVNRAAQVGLRRMFPELARWSDRLDREGKPGPGGQEGDPRIRGDINRFGDIDLESLYSSMMAMSFSNGWKATTLTNYFNFLVDTMTPQVGRYSRIATMRDHAQQPDADRLRFLLGGYQQRKAEAEARGLEAEDYAIYKDVIDAERTRMEVVYLLSTSMNKADAYFFALHKTADQVLDNPTLRKKVTDHFPQAMNRVLVLRDMPEVRKLILSQTRPAGGRIFWTQSDVQGILDALGQGWEASLRQAKIDGAGYGQADLRAHVRNTLTILDNPAVYRAGQKFFRGLGWAVSDKDSPREKTLFASRLASVVENYLGRPMHSFPGEWTTPEITAAQAIDIIDRLLSVDAKVDEIKSEGDLTYLLQMADEARRKYGEGFAPLFDHRHRNSPEASQAPDLTDAYFLESRRQIPLLYDQAVADLFLALTGEDIRTAGQINWETLAQGLTAKKLGQPLAPWETPDQRVRMARFLVEGFDVKVNPRDPTKIVHQISLKDQRIPSSVAEALAFDTLPKMGLTPKEWKGRVQRGLLWQVQSMALSQDRWGVPVTMMGQGDLEGLITRAEQVNESDEKVQSLIWVQSEMRRRYDKMNAQLIAKGKLTLPALDETTVTGLASWVLGPLGREKTEKLINQLEKLSDASKLTGLMTTLSDWLGWDKENDPFMIYRLAREYSNNKSRLPVSWYLDVFFADAKQMQEKIHELKTVSSEGYVAPFMLSMYLTLAQEKQPYMNWFNRATGYADKLAKERTNDPLFGDLRDAQGKEVVDQRLAFLIAANIENRILDALGIEAKAKKLGEVRERALNVYGLAKELVSGFLVELSSRMDSWSRGADRDFRDADDSFVPTAEFKTFLSTVGEKVSPSVEKALADIPNRFARSEVRAARDKESQQLNADPALQKEREAQRPVITKQGPNAYAADVVKAAEKRGISLDMDFTEMSLLYQEAVAQGYTVADAVELASLQIDAQTRFRKVFNLGDQPLTTIQKGTIAGLSNAVFARWGALTRTGSPTDLVRYQAEVAKDQSDMDLTLQAAELLDRRINKGVFAGNPAGQVLLKRIMTMASIAVERGVVFYGSNKTVNLTYVNDFFNTFNVVQKDAIELGLWPKDNKKAGRLGNSLLLRLDRAMDVGLWDSPEEPIRTREEYGDAVKKAFESFRADLGDVKSEPRGTQRFANSKFSPEAIVRLEKQVADTLFKRQLPPAHVAILIERAKIMGEEIKKAAQYGQENLTKDPEIALIGRAIQQPDPVTLLVLADKAYPDSVYSLDLADILSQLLDENGGEDAVSERASKKAVDMMNHASDQWAKTLRSAMLQGLRQYLPKNRKSATVPTATEVPAVIPAVVPVDLPPASPSVPTSPAESVKTSVVDQKPGAFVLGNMSFMMGALAFLVPNKNWSKWAIPAILLVLLMNPLMALAATMVDPIFYAGVYSGIAGTFSGAASYSTTFVGSVLENSGTISLLLFSGATLLAIYQGMKESVAKLIQKFKQPKGTPPVSAVKTSEPSAATAKAQETPRSKMKELYLPIFLGVLTLAAIFMAIAWGSAALGNSFDVVAVQGWLDDRFALAAAQPKPFLVDNNVIALHEWLPFMSWLADIFGSSIFAGWAVSFSLSLLVGLATGAKGFGRPDRSHEPNDEDEGPSIPRASSIEGGVDILKPDTLNRGAAVMSFWVFLPVFMAAAFGPAAVVSGSMANLILFALVTSLGIAIVNGFRDWARKVKVGNGLGEKPWKFWTFRVFIFYINFLTFLVVATSLAAGDLTGFSLLTGLGVVLIESYLITGSHLKFVAWLVAWQELFLAFLFGDPSVENRSLANPPKLAKVVINADGEGNAVGDHVVLFENPTDAATEAKQREILAGLRAKMIENPTMIAIVRIVNLQIESDYQKRAEKFSQIIWEELFDHPDMKVGGEHSPYMQINNNGVEQQVCRVIIPIREAGRLDKPWSYMLDMAAEAAISSVWVDEKGQLFFGDNPADTENYPQFEGITVLDGPTVEKKKAGYEGDKPWPFTSAFLVPKGKALGLSDKGVFDNSLSWFYGVEGDSPVSGYSRLDTHQGTRKSGNSVVAYRMVNDIDIRQPTGELANIVYEAEIDPEHVIFQPTVMNRSLNTLRAVAESDAQFMLRHMAVLTSPLLLGDGRAGGKFLIAQKKYTDKMLAPKPPAQAEEGSLKRFLKKRGFNFKTKEDHGMPYGAYVELSLRGSKPVIGKDESKWGVGDGWVLYAQTVMELSRPTIILGLSLVLGLVTGSFALGTLFPIIYYFAILPQLIKAVPKSERQRVGMPKLFASHDEAEGIVVEIRILMNSVTLDVSRWRDDEDKALYYKWRAFFDHFTEWARMTGKVSFPVPARFFNNLVIRGNVGAALWMTVLALRLFATWSAASYGVMLPLPALILYGYLMFILLQDKVTGAWLQHLWIVLRAGLTQAGEVPVKGDEVRSQRGHGLMAGIAGLGALTVAFTVMGVVQGVWIGAVISAMATVIYVVQKLILLSGSEFGKRGWFVSRGPMVGALAWVGAWVVFGMVNWAWAATAFSIVYGLYYVLAFVFPSIYEKVGRKIHTELDVNEGVNGKTATASYKGFLKTRPWNLNTLTVSMATPFVLVDYFMNAVYEFGYTAVTLLSNLIHDFRFTRFGFHAVKNLLIKRIAPLWNNQPTDKLTKSVLDYFGFFRAPIIAFLVFWAFASVNGSLEMMGMPSLALSPTAFNLIGFVAALIFVKQYQYTTEPVFKEYKGKTGMSEDPYPEFYRYVGWGVVSLFVLLFFSPLIGEVIPAPALLFGATLILAMGISALVNWFGGREWPKWLRERSISVTQLFGIVLLGMVVYYYVAIEPVGPLVSVMDTLTNTWFGADWVPPALPFSDEIKDSIRQIPAFGFANKRAMLPALFSMETFSNVLQAFPLIGIVHVFTAAAFMLFGGLGVLSAAKSLGWDSVALLRSTYPKNVETYIKVRNNPKSTAEQIAKAKREASLPLDRAIFETSLVILTVGVVFNPWIAAATALFLGGRGLIEWNRMKNEVKGTSPWPLRILGLILLLGILGYAGGAFAAPVIESAKDIPSGWASVGQWFALAVPLILGRRVFIGWNRVRLEVAAKAYFDLLNKGEQLDKMDPRPSAILLLGNPFLQSVTDLAAKWKDGFGNVPIVLAGGKGPGTPGLLAAVKEKFNVDEAKILAFLNNQSPEIYTLLARDSDSLTEADLMRFALLKNGVPSSMISQESVPSGTIDDNFRNTQKILTDLVGPNHPNVGVVTGAPMRLRFGAVAANLETSLSLPYKPVVMDVGPLDLSVLSDDELASLVQGRAGNNGGEVAWWANALSREMTPEEQQLQGKLEEAKIQVLDHLKKFESRSLRSWTGMFFVGVLAISALFYASTPFAAPLSGPMAVSSVLATVGPWVMGPVILVLFGSVQLYRKMGDGSSGNARILSFFTQVRNAVGSFLQSTGANLLRFGRTGVALGSLAAEKIVKTPALVVALVMGGVGVASAAGVMGAGALGSLGTGATGASAAGVPVLFAMALSAVPAGAGSATTFFRWNLPSSLEKWARSGGFLATPGVPSTEKKGDALVVDMRAGTLDPAVGKILLDRLTSLGLRALDDPDGKLHIEFVVGNAPRPGDVARITKAFRELAAPSGLSASATEKITLGVVAQETEGLKARLADLSAFHINVVAPASAVDFWSGLGLPLTVFAAKFLNDLLNVEVEIVYTGAAAQAAVALSNGQLKMDKGQVRLKNVATPLEMIDQDKQKIQLFNQQA